MTSDQGSHDHDHVAPDPIETDPEAVETALHSTPFAPP